MSNSERTQIVHERQVKLASGTRNCRILLIDPSDAQAQELQRALSEHGFYVFWCNSATEALTEFAASKWDLAITRVEMPDIDGFVLLKAIRAARDYVPVILTTTALSHAVTLRASAEKVQRIMQLPTKAENICREATDAILVGRLVALQRKAREHQNNYQAIRDDKLQMSLVFDPIFDNTNKSLLAHEAMFSTNRMRFDAASIAAGLRDAVAKSFSAFHTQAKIIVPVTHADVASEILTLHESPLTKYNVRVIYCAHIDGELANTSEFEGGFARVRKYGFKTMLDGFLQSRESAVSMRLKPHFLRFDTANFRGCEEGDRRQLDIMSEYCRRSSTTLIADGVTSQDDEKMLQEHGISVLQGPYIRKKVGPIF